MRLFAVRPTITFALGLSEIHSITCTPFIYILPMLISGGDMYNTTRIPIFKNSGDALVDVVFAKLREGGPF